jgi:prepilin-type N-terminal cleavage/methylation domain-containing protein
MNGKCRTSSRRRRQYRRGLTLVEVIAGLALLSTLLVAVLTVTARTTRQSANATRRLQAIAGADRLLAGWWQDRAKLPRESSGHVPGDAGFVWRTTPVRNDAVNALAASVIRLEVFDRQRTVLASVEIVLDDDKLAENPEHQVLTLGGAP